MTYPRSVKTEDGLDLALHIWEPRDTPRVLICLVHGLGEHSRRYDHLAAFLNERGIALWAFDLRGHGLSGGPRGHAPSYLHLLHDISSFLALARERHGKLPLFLYGHSFGGGQVINYILRQSPALTGAVATGPLLKTTLPPPTWKITMARIMNGLWPTLTLPSELDATAISRDPAVVAAYRQDPLVHDRLSVRMGIEMLAAGQWALDHAHELPIPLLLMHGSADRLCSCRASEDFAAKAGGLCNLKVWPGFYHEVHNEPEKEEVFAYLLMWLNEQLSRR